MLYKYLYPFEKSGNSSDQNNEQHNGATATNISNNRNNILLQTATAVVSNVNISETLTTNLMLDSGSQGSYISSELRLNLNLPKLWTERLLIKTFGDTNFKCQNADIVLLNIVTSNKVITIEAMCTPLISESLSNQNVRKVCSNYNHLKDLKLADSSDKEIKNIEILIRLDYYYQIVTVEIIRGKSNEPIALGSIFGWVF